MNGVLALYKELPSGARDAIKTLMTNIQFASISQDKELKTITLTSCIPNEGKSLISTFLAIAMSENGKRTLIMDCDYRHPSVRKSMMFKKGKGVGSYYRDGAKLEDIVIPTGYEGLYLLDCEVKIPNPVEMINSESFIRLLDEAKEKFDVVIVDTPPLGSFIDAALIAAQTDATAVVVRSGVVDKKIISGAMEQLEKAKANVIGAVINCVETSKTPYYYYYKYYNNYYGTNKNGQVK